MTNNEIVLSVFEEMYLSYQNNDFVIDRSGSKMIELINHTMSLNPDESELNIKNIRKTPKYAKRELEWYLSQSININDMPGKIPKIWKDISNDYDEINSNYGYLVFSNENYNQFNKCLETLIKNKYSRRATMIYNRPSIQIEYNQRNMNDFICTYFNQFLIRNNKLISIYNMRSNDIIFGFFNDFYWACYVYNRLYNELKKEYPELKKDKIIWQVASLHVYERHFDLLKKICED